MASWPTPENHLESFPCRRRRSIFSSITRGRRRARCSSRSFSGVKLSRGDGPGGGAASTATGFSFWVSAEPLPAAPSVSLMATFELQGAGEANPASVVSTITLQHAAHASRVARQLHVPFARDPPAHLHRPLPVRERRPHLLVREPGLEVEVEAL